MFVLLALLPSASCDRGSEVRESRLRELVPSLDEEMLQHLVRDDDEAFREYGISTGVTSLLTAQFLLMETLDTEDPSVWEDRGKWVLPMLDRITTLNDEEFFLSSSRARVEYLMSCSAEEGIRHRKKSRSIYRIFEDDTLSAEEKKKNYEDLIEYFMQKGFPGLAVMAEGKLIELLGDLGEEEEGLRHMYHVIDLASRSGVPRLYSQNLGVLARHHLAQARVDSAFHYLDRSLEVAERSRLPGQAARIHSFYSSLYEQDGRYALALRHLDRAVELCREFKGGSEELRYLLIRLWFLVPFDCWDLIERDLPRAELLLSMYPDVKFTNSKAVYGVGIQALAASALFHRGDAEAADSILRSIAPTVESMPRPRFRLDFLREWSVGLLASSLPERALRVSETGLRLAESREDELFTNTFLVMQLECLLHLGRTEAAEWAIERLEDELGGTPDSWVHHLRRARLHHLMKDRDTADRHLNLALEFLRKSLSSDARGVGVYLNLGRAGELRNMLHELTGADPRGGLGVELIWRTLTAWSTNPAREPLADSEAQVKELENWCEAHGGHLLLYAAGRDTLTRWTLSADRLRMGRIPLGERELGDRLARVLEDVESESSGGGSELVENLDELAALLLPEEYLAPDGRRPAPLLLAPDGPLRRVPFEILDLDPGPGYRPLLADWNPAYLHSMVPPGSPDEDAPLVLADPELSSSLRRRLPHLTELPAAVAEGRGFASRHPNTELLIGPEATKRALLERWESARVLYLATHQIRDPEMPYYTFLPLAAGADEPGWVSGVLEIGEIMAADLSGCELVVLSSCASAVAHPGTAPAAPSLGDAFLDAGAHAVVGSFWPVRDDLSAALMVDFDQRRSAGLDPVSALAATRRARITAPDLLRNVSEWAGFGISVNAPPPGAP